MTVVIATGGINISVGSAMALSAMLAAKLIKDGQLVLGLIVGLLCALVFGWITGMAVIKFKIQPMIVSLSMMFVLRGIAKLVSDGRIMTYRNKAFSDFFLWRGLRLFAGAHGHMAGAGDHFMDLFEQDALWDLY